MDKFYDPPFYEYQALQYLAKELGEPIKLQVRLPDLSIPLSRRNELDGLVEIKGEPYPIEVKSYPLDNDSVFEIASKYRSLGFRKLFLIAPDFTVSGQTDKNIEKVRYAPDGLMIRKYYERLQFNLSDLLLQELSTGWHNFRFRLLFRSPDSPNRYFNQIDKRIKTPQALTRELLRRTPKHNPPVKVLWSIGRWLSPKDLFRGDAGNQYLGGPLVFDIDGPLIHRSYSSCEISPAHGLCEQCFFFAKREAARLLSFLESYGFRKIEIYFSGRAGFHVYVYDTDELGIEEKTHLLKEIRNGKIRIDACASTGLKRDIGFPQTLHAASLYPITKVGDIQNFAMEHVKIVV